MNNETENQEPEKRIISLEDLGTMVSECVNQNLNSKDFVMDLYEYLTDAKVKELSETSFEIEV